ncbi:bifunctional pyridoxal-dependent enzyme [Elusimicrobium simillimum]
MNNQIPDDFFDTIINRAGTGSIKYAPAMFGKPADIIPMWVADMDFKVPPAVTAALKTAAEHAIFGYSHSGSEYDTALCNWFKTRHNWNIKPGWNVQTPNVLFALTAAIHAFTKTGDAVMICQPVYPPFEQIILGAKRTLVINNLKLENNKYYIDFNAFENDIRKNNVKMFVLCSPITP